MLETYCCVAFEKLGADVVYAEGLQSPGEMQALHSRLARRTPTMLAQVEGHEAKLNFMRVDAETGEFVRDAASGRLMWDLRKLRNWYYRRFIGDRTCTQQHKCSA